jgi:hypothetical protein
VKNKGFALILEDEKPNKQTGFWKKSELQTLKEGIQWMGSYKRLESLSVNRRKSA